MSVVAPFEYISLVFAPIIGYLAFGDVPTLPMLISLAILISAGVFVIFRGEHQLGVEWANAKGQATP